MLDRMLRPNVNVKRSIEFFETPIFIFRHETRYLAICRLIWRRL
jgi:hypothetical protein